MSMPKDEQVLLDIVNRMVDNGSLDELVLAVLETSLEAAFEDLERLSKKEYFEPHHWQDYADNLTFAKAAIRVLQYFSKDMYTSEQEKANYYATKLGEL